jgi:hypothetical protein
MPHDPHFHDCPNVIAGKPCGGKASIPELGSVSVWRKKFLGLSSWSDPRNDLAKNTL